MPILEARELVKSYGNRLVVKGVTVAVRSGEIIGLLGPNGAGKTTIFQMIVGLIRPDRGGIFIDGKDISRAPTHKRAIAGLTYLPQENSVFLNASVSDNLRLALELQPDSRRDWKTPAREILREFGLLPLAAQPAHSLSGGERRRLEIGRALILKPKFLLLDEPFTGIDPLTIAELQKIMAALKKRGIGILLSDHNVRDTFMIADRVYIIDEGEILIHDVPHVIAGDPKARRRFLGTEFAFGEERKIHSRGDDSLPPSVSPRKKKNRNK
jgi:lipopolysaccharide export system ATP-binding protein